MYGYGQNGRYAKRTRLLRIITNSPRLSRASYLRSSFNTGCCAHQSGLRRSCVNCGTSFADTASTAKTYEYLSKRSITRQHYCALLRRLRIHLEPLRASRRRSVRNTAVAPQNDLHARASSGAALLRSQQVRQTRRASAKKSQIVSREWRCADARWQGSLQPQGDVYAVDDAGEHQATHFNDVTLLA